MFTFPTWVDPCVVKHMRCIERMDGKKTPFYCIWDEDKWVV